MIDIRDLEFVYPAGDFQLRVPELRIAAGESAAVIGPSGCGKTTLLHLVAGIAVPRRGRVLLDGRDLGGLSEAARRELRIRSIGLVFQEFELLDYLNVRDNILLPYRISPGIRLDGAARERGVRLAERIGLGDKLDRLAPRLSQGERQRVAVARALVTEPQAVLADEPTGNLDPGNTETVLEIVFEDAAERGTTVVMVTHQHELVSRFSRTVDFQTITATGGAAGPDRGRGEVGATP